MHQLLRCLTVINARNVVVAQISTDKLGNDGDALHRLTLYRDKIRDDAKMHFTSRDRGPSPQSDEELA